jgi:hypothetical protein
MGIRTVPGLILIAVLGVPPVVYLANHPIISVSAPQYTMQDAQADIKQCKDAGFDYQPELMPAEPRVSDHGGQVYGIECLTPRGGSIRADAHLKIDRD